MHVVPYGIHKSGWLEKRGLFTIWFSRFVRLVTYKDTFKHYLLYFDDDKYDSEPKGKIDLESCIALPCDEQMDKKFSFKISHPHNSTQYFQAKNQSDQVSWLRSSWLIPD